MSNTHEGEDLCILCNQEFTPTVDDFFIYPVAVSLDRNEPCGLTRDIEVHPVCPRCQRSIVRGALSAFLERGADMIYPNAIRREK